MEVPAGKMNHSWPHFLFELSEAFKRTLGVRVLFLVIHPILRALDSVIISPSVCEFNVTFHSLPAVISILDGGSGMFRHCNIPSVTSNAV